MRTSHLTFVSAAAMGISAALVYWVTPAGGAAGARAGVELAPAAMLEPDSEWFRGGAEAASPGAAAVPTAMITSAPLAVAEPEERAVPERFPFEFVEKKVEPPRPGGVAAAPITKRRKAPTSKVSFEAPRAFAKPPPAVPKPFPQQAALPQPAFPQQAFPQQAALPVSTAVPAPSSTSFGSKK
jgi:hypothetical protein